MIMTIFAKIGDKCSLPGTNQDAFFGIPHWWKYLGGEKDGLDKCTPQFNGLNDVWPILIALTEALLTIAGMLAVVMIIVAGFNYLTSTGEADKTAQARQRIINTLVGLAIIVVASAVVRFIGSTLGG